MKAPGNLGGVSGGSLRRKWRKKSGKKGEVRRSLPHCPSCWDVESRWEGTWESCLALGESCLALGEGGPCDLFPDLLPSRQVIIGSKFPGEMVSLASLPGLIFRGVMMGDVE